MEVDNELFLTNGSTVIPSQPLDPGTYQYTVLLKSHKSTVSRCHVVITVPIPTTVLPSLPTVIYIPQNYSNPIFTVPRGIRLAGNSNFAVSEGGMVRATKPLNRGAVYKVGDVRVMMDDVIDVPNQEIHMVNWNGPLNSTCQEIAVGYHVTKDCRVVYSNPGTYSNPENAISIQILGPKSAIGHLIQDLRSTYSDMKIYPLAIWEMADDVRYRLILAFVDRNGVTLDPKEAGKTLTSFFRKMRPNYMEFMGIDPDPCERCPFKCEKDLAGIQISKRIISSYNGSIFNFPRKKLVGKCLNEEKVEKKPESEFLESKIQRCSEQNSAFESLYPCEKAMDPFSTVSKDFMEISMKNSTNLEKCGDGCEKDVQKIEIDFRTTKMDMELIRVEFEKQTAVVEIHSGSISFSISDAYTRPIQTKIDKPANDGKWHRLLLQMSDSGKRISIQVDGRGKEVKSRVSLPMLFTSKKIQLMTSPIICFRRLLIQNQFSHPLHLQNQYFQVSAPKSTVISTCQSDLSTVTPSNITTVILLSILSILTVIGITVCVLAIRKKKKNAETGWKKATEIDAFAIPRGRGHVNRSMVKDEDGYDVAMKSTSTDDMTIYTTSSSKRYQPQVLPYRRDGHINMAYL